VEEWVQRAETFREEVVQRKAARRTLEAGARESQAEAAKEACIRSLSLVQINHQKVNIKEIAITPEGTQEEEALKWVAWPFQVAAGTEEHSCHQTVSAAGRSCPAEVAEAKRLPLRLCEGVRRS
jgi:hypothetical protein